MKKTLLFAAVFFISSSVIVINAAAQSSAGGRAGEPAGTESTFKPKPRPVVKRTIPKRTVRPGKTAAAYEAEGNAFYDAKDYDSALVAYQNAAKLKPTVKSLYRIGWIYNDFSEYAKALPPLNQALAIDADQAVVYLEKGYALRRLKQENEAVAALKKSIELDPNSSIANFELGSLNSDMNMFNEAVASFRRAISIKPDYADAYEGLGGSLRHLGRNSEAITAFNKAIELDPEDSGGYMGLGDVYYYGTREYQKAIDAYEQGLQHDADNNVAAYNVGWAYNELGNYNNAIKWLNEAVRIKPDYSSAYAEIGYANYKLKQETAAVAAYQKALQYKPGYAVAYIGMGDVYFDISKNYPLAAENYRKSLIIEPDNAKALYRLGYCDNDEGKYQDAVTYLSRAKQLKPDWGNVRVELGYAYWKLKRGSEAELSFRDALAIDNDDQLAHYYLGQLYLEGGNRSAAMTQYRELQRLRSSYAQKLMDRINGNE